jgi:uncharacterized damage-inducible protein DinB
MGIFGDLYRYNQWANAKVFGVCRDLDPGLLTAAAPGTTGSIDDTLKHLVGVEGVYLILLRDQSLGPRDGRESYFAHDVGWFAERAAQIGDGYLALLPNLDDARLDSALAVPWFDFPITKRDGLHQVLSHSAQHRAQVLSVLGARGLAVPNLDYIFMIQERRQPGSG